MPFCGSYSLFGDASAHMTRVRTDIDGAGVVHQKYDNYSSWQGQSDGIWGGMTNASGETSLAYAAVRSTPNVFNGVTPFIPIQPFLKRQTGNGKQGFFGGQVLDMRYCNVTNFLAGQVAPIGGDDWLVFPAVVKNNPTPDDYNSGPYGFAYKRIV